MDRVSLMTVRNGHGQSHSDDCQEGSSSYHSPVTHHPDPLVFGSRGATVLYIRLLHGKRTVKLKVGQVGAGKFMGIMCYSRELLGLFSSILKPNGCLERNSINHSRRYGPLRCLLLAPADGFGLRPRQKKKELIIMFWPIFGNFWCPVVTQ